MTLIDIFFGVGAIVTSFLVVSSRHSVYSVFYLILCFCFSSCLLLTLTVDFLSIVFIVVYVGAIAVLFLFIVMMLNLKFQHLSENFNNYGFSILILGLVFVGEVLFIVSNNLPYFSKESKIFVSNLDLLSSTSNITSFGDTVYTSYASIFLISSLILFLSMVGSISLTLHHSNFVKRQEVYKQVNRKLSNSLCYFY